MKQFKPFFGEIVGKNDLDYMNLGNREAIAQTHNVFTNNLGGVLDGLDVVQSNDNKTVLISPGTLISAGIYSETNNSGGGEIAKLYSQNVTTNFPETPPQGSLPTYILVSAQVSTVNINPNPLQSQILVTSKNLQTGENVATREYPQVNIIFSNPIIESSISSVEGVPLAKFQVNYNGIVKSDTNRKIYNFDTSIKRNYIIANSLDVAEQELVADGVPDDFIITRMIADNQVSGPKFLDNSIGTSKIAQWDGTTVNNDLTGSGVATQNLKDDAVTEAKINYSGSMVNFNTRNRVSNSSFETPSGTPSGTTLLPAYWDANYNSTVGTQVRMDLGEDYAKFGSYGLFLDGAVSAGTAQSVSVSQIITFEDYLKNVPLTPFFWAKQTAEPNFSTTGTTGLQGKIEFLDSSNAVLQTETFITLSGITSVNYEQYFSPSPLIYTGPTSCTKVRYTIGGSYDGAYYIDGVFLGITSIVPKFDIAPSEYITATTDIGTLGGTIVNGQFTDNTINGSRIINGTISNGKLAGSILGSQLSDRTITSTKIGLEQVGQNEISSSFISSLTTQIVNQTVAQLGPRVATAWGSYEGYYGTLLSSYNVGSVNKIATGHYRINFSTAMNNANYVVVFGGDYYGVFKNSYQNNWTIDLYDESGNPTSPPRKTVNFFEVRTCGDWPNNWFRDRLFDFVVYGGI